MWRRETSIPTSTEISDCLCAFVRTSDLFLFEQRGRWWSDVAEIYQRPLLSSQLAASLWVRPGGSADLESLCAGFAQVATR